MDRDGEPIATVHACTYRGCGSARHRAVGKAGGPSQPGFAHRAGRRRRQHAPDPRTLTEEQAERMLAGMNEVIRAGEEMRKLRSGMIKVFAGFGWTQERIAQLTEMS